MGILCLSASWVQRILDGQIKYYFFAIAKYMWVLTPQLGPRASWGGNPHGQGATTLDPQLIQLRTGRGGPVCVDLFEGLLRWRSFDGWFIMVGRRWQTLVHEQNQASHLIFVNDTLLIHSHAQFTVLCSAATLWQNLCVSSKQKMPSGSLGGNTW